MHKRICRWVEKGQECRNQIVILVMIKQLSANGIERGNVDLEIIVNTYMVITRKKYRKRKEKTVHKIQEQIVKLERRMTKGKEDTTQGCQNG